MSFIPIRNLVHAERTFHEITTISANSSNTGTILEEMDQFCPPTSSDLRSQIWREAWTSTEPYVELVKRNDNHHYFADNGHLSRRNFINILI